ncbi:MAG: hypothetical protein HYR63_02125 [Proteobacteria bacterium]|nr:hypothetical protein [Pseudomonadota bacterium]
MTGESECIQREQFEGGIREPGDDIDAKGIQVHRAAAKGAPSTALMRRV